MLAGGPVVRVRARVQVNACPRSTGVLAIARLRLVTGVGAAGDEAEVVLTSREGARSAAVV